VKQFEKKRTKARRNLERASERSPFIANHHEDVQVEPDGKRRNVIFKLFNNV